jgi:succinyl-CoA synthetase alpha subunit
LIKQIAILRNRYLDSVFLMQVARRMAASPGIQDASALLGTDANKAVLAGMGYGGLDAGPNDLVVALEGEPRAVEAVAADLEAWLAPGVPGTTPDPRTLEEALRTKAADVAVISVPGVHAAREARAALRAGLHVFLFSSNVSLEDEVSLKQEARERGLIVMGPDCGTAWLAGAGLGFTNAVRRGPVGIVGSTGTGMQEFACLLHRAGSGISHGIGTGGRDLGDAVGGISTLAGIEALEADPATQVIVVLSKPPGAAATAKLTERLKRCKKPVLQCLLGGEATLDDAVIQTLLLLGLEPPAFLRPRDSPRLISLRPEQRYVRGLFAGGTLCYQAQAIFAQAGLTVHSNAPLPGMRALGNPEQSEGNTFLDMGAEYFVDGRPHPMIDGTQRRRRLEREFQDPSVAVVLLDFILGTMSSADPVREVLDVLPKGLCVAASVCGTEGDAQGLEGQVRTLEGAGVRVLPTAAQAACFCRDAARTLQEGS